MSALPIFTLARTPGATSTVEWMELSYHATLAAAEKAARKSAADLSAS